MDNSVHNYIKLSFKDGLDPNFIMHLSDTISKQLWELIPIMPATYFNLNMQNSGNNPKSLPQIKTRTGINGRVHTIMVQRIS